MIQTIIISVSISAVVSGVFTFFMISKASKALSVEVTKYISRTNKTK